MKQRIGDMIIYKGVKVQISLSASGRVEDIFIEREHAGGIVTEQWHLAGYPTTNKSILSND